jgi:hypothetical protein
MSADTAFTKENLNECLKALAKEFRRRNGTAVPAEIILVGGASILANYGFREMTYDMDAVVSASAAMKEAVNAVGDQRSLRGGWLNTDFTRTKSYSDRLFEVSVYYRTFSNIVTVRTVAAEFLVAMKLMSGRRYKNDLSDIVGILWEHQKSGSPITWEAVDAAVCKLYGGWNDVPPISKSFIEAALANNDLEALYRQSRESEQQSQDILLVFDQQYPNALKAENIDAVLEQARRMKQG